VHLSLVLAISRVPVALLDWRLVPHVLLIDWAKEVRHNERSAYMSVDALVAALRVPFVGFYAAKQVVAWSLSCHGMDGLLANQSFGVLLARNVRDH
jgi:hypothetical protein